MDTFTVRELIEELKCFPDDMEVRIAQPQHNYWGEISAQPVLNIEKEKVRVDDKNTTCPNKILDEDPDDEGDGDQRYESITALILS